MSNQNISQSTTNDHLPASMQPISVTKAEIQGLVAWITSAGKVSYLDASMVLETAVINATIKLGLIVEQDNYLILAGLVEQVVTHAQTHLVQTSNHVADCGFFESLPSPTPQDVSNSMFGKAPSSTSSLVRQAEIFVSNRNAHEKIAAEIRKDLAQLETKYGKQSQSQQAQTQQQNPQIETKVFPIFKGLKLKNADRAERDGYLLYVGSRNDCVRAVTQYQRGSVKQNSKNGHSWKFILSLKDFNSLSSTHTFNFKKYASEAVQAYRNQQISFLEEVATY